MSDTLTVGSVTMNGTTMFVLDCNDDDAPEPDYEVISVPGRSGDLHIWNERWKNKLITYQCMCTDNARTAVPALLTQLLAQYGYQRITDTLHTDYYKMGEYVGATTPVYSDGGKTARFDLTFDCKPQKWLLSGDSYQALTSGSTTTLTSPSTHKAYPIIRVEGSGQIRIQNTTSTPYLDFTLTSSGYADPASVVLWDYYFDCELMDATKSETGVSNQNSHITLGSTEQICLGPGNNRITVASTLRAEIKPRWYKL